MRVSCQSMNFLWKTIQPWGLYSTTWNFKQIVVNEVHNKLEELTKNLLLFSCENINRRMSGQFGYFQPQNMNLEFFRSCENSLHAPALLNDMVVMTNCSIEKLVLGVHHSWIKGIQLVHRRSRKTLPNMVLNMAIHKLL